jgi:acetolactate synthase-1/2/3 large subunit
MKTGAKLLVECLEYLGIEHIFGIPGAKIDSVFDALIDSKIKLIHCRHEQNAVFMAASYAKTKSKPAVVLVTSGPGVSNLTTGLLTATTEGYPIVAIGANLSQNMLQRDSHQSLNNVKLLETVCKSSIEIQATENIPEILANAFRLAETPNPGACFISIPQNILLQNTLESPIQYTPPIRLGSASEELLSKAVNFIIQSKKPALLIGMTASHKRDSDALNALLKHFPLPVVCTFQGAGLVSKENMHCFAGRVGLFRNEPGDILLDQADLIITLGFKPVEYDPETWNQSRKPIIHLDYIPCAIQRNYQPIVELTGDVVANLTNLKRTLTNTAPSTWFTKIVKNSQTCLENDIRKAQGSKHEGVKPLQFIHSLRDVVDEHTQICCDVGSVYMWMARYFFSHHPRQLFFSNGQQTLGVALPMAIGCRLANEMSTIISISGDGGFLYSATELETAVRENLKIIHFVWSDGYYDMVKQQQALKYGRTSGVTLGQLNVKKFASAFGALGLVLEKIEDFTAIYQEAQASTRPVIIDVKINYEDNPMLFKISNEEASN